MRSLPRIGLRLRRAFGGRCANNLRYDSKPQASGMSRWKSRDWLFFQTMCYCSARHGCTVFGFAPLCNLPPPCRLDSFDDSAAVTAAAVGCCIGCRSGSCTADSSMPAKRSSPRTVHNVPEAVSPSDRAPTSPSKRRVVPGFWLSFHRRSTQKSNVLRLFLRFELLPTAWRAAGFFLRQEQHRSGVAHWASRCPTPHASMPPHARPRWLLVRASIQEVFVSSFE